MGFAFLLTEEPEPLLLFEEDEPEVFLLFEEDEPEMVKNARTTPAFALFPLITAVAVPGLTLLT